MTTKQRLACGAAILRSIDARRQRTGNRNELLALEQAIVDRELIELDTRETGVPFWVNLVSASAPSLPTRIALFTLRSAIEFSSSFEIFDCFFGPGRSATCLITAERRGVVRGTRIRRRNPAKS